jgi:xylono-1,5-lactonase
VQPALPQGSPWIWGHVWLALWGSGLAHRYSYAGRLDSIVHVPASHASGCTFAAWDLSTLVVTTPVEGLSEEEREAQPQAVHDARRT